MSHLLQLLMELSVLGFLIGSMAAMGLTLTPRAVLAPLRNGRLVLLALGLNFVFAPAFAWLLTRTIPLAHGHAIGLLLLGGAAGAPFLPTLIEIARKDPGLAAALTGLLTAGTIIFLPVAFPLMIPGLKVDGWSIARPLLLLIVAPCVGGMLIKACAASLAARAVPIFAAIGNAGLLILFVLLVALNLRALLGVIGSGAILAALLYIVGLFAVSWLSGGAEGEARGVLALATAARNFGAALAPAASFTDPNVTVMIVVCAVVCLVATFLAARWVRRRGFPAAYDQSPIAARRRER